MEFERFWLTFQKRMRHGLEPRLRERLSGKHARKGLGPEFLAWLGEWGLGSQFGRGAWGQNVQAGLMGLSLELGFKITLEDLDIQGVA